MPDPTQRIRDNVAKMRAQHASDADVEHYLRDVEGLSPVSSVPTAPARPASMPAVADDEEPGLGRRIFDTIVNVAEGVPGAKLAQAGYTQLGNLAFGTHEPMTYEESLKAVGNEADRLPKGRQRAARLLGATAITPLLPANPTVAGAILGGADEALAADDESLGERAKNTVLGTAAGAATGKVLGSVGKGIATLGQKTGATDAIASGARKLGDIVPGPVGDGLSSIGESIGTRGAGNKLLSDRQSILDQLTGSEKDAAQTVADHADAYHAQAKKLYDVARADTKVVDDPRVRDALADPHLQQLFQVTRERLGFAPNPTEVAPGVPAVMGTPRLLTSGTPPEPPPVASGAPQSVRDAINDFYDRIGVAARRTEGTPQQQTARTALERRSAEASLPTPAARVLGASLQEPIAPRAEVPATVIDLPTPEELALTKRLLSSVVQQKFNAPTGINPAEAAQLAPKLDQLRAALHDASPAWKDADAYYAQAKNLETAFSKAYGAQQKVTAAGLEPRKLKTQEAISRWADDAAGTPVGDARAAGQQAGTASRIAESVRNAPLEPTISETLGAAGQIFQPSEAAAAIRRPAFATDDAAEAFAKLVGKLQRATPPTPPATKNPLTWGRSVNPLTTEAGGELRQTLAAQLANPSKEAALRAMMESSARGRALLAALTRSALPTANSPFANRDPSLSAP